MLDRMTQTRTMRKTFPGTSRHVGQARQFVRESLGAEFPYVENAMLMVSELATNTIDHTSSHINGTFDVTCLRCGNWALIAVSDQGSDTVPCPGKSSPDSLNGRGLMILGELAQRWGFIHDKNTGGMVWAELGEPDHKPPLGQAAQLLWSR
jgi:anti-sigma regulatory factor (Ser/Thr protein kinase)